MLLRSRKYIARAIAARRRELCVAQVGVVDANRDLERSREGEAGGRTGRVINVSAICSLLNRDRTIEIHDVGH